MGFRSRGSEFLNPASPGRRPNVIMFMNRRGGRRPGVFRSHKLSSGVSLNQSFQGYSISGRTLDSSSNPVGNCEVDLYRSATEVKIDSTTSDASGNFSFTVGNAGEACFIVAYKPGSPDIAGTTVDTLMPS